MTKINAQRVVQCCGVYIDLDTIKEIRDDGDKLIIIILLKGHEYVNHPENGWTLIEPKIVIKRYDDDYIERLVKKWEAYLRERDSDRT
jgi:hypothetical protein